MEDERPERAEEEFSVRLTWPKLPERPPEEAEPAAPPPAPPAGARRTPARPAAPEAPDSAPEAAPKRAGRGGPRATVRAGAAARAGTGTALGPVQPASGPAAPSRRPPALPEPKDPAAARPPEAPTATERATPAPRHVAPPRPAGPGSSGVVSAASALPDSSMARAFVDAFERLSERLLERLRTLRQDIDADLNGLRAEVATLRQAVDDAGQSVQLRQLHTGLDELRADLSGLRRAVLEVPELQRLADEVTAVRGDLTLLFDAAGDGGEHAPSAVVVELEQVVGRLSEQIGRLDERAGSRELAWLVDEVASVRSDLTELAKRSRATVRLDPDQLRLIADAVTHRLLEELEAGSRRGSRRK